MVFEKLYKFQALFIFLLVSHTIYFLCMPLLPINPHICKFKKKISRTTTNIRNMTNFKLGFWLNPFFGRIIHFLDNIFFIRRVSDFLILYVVYLL